MMNKPIFMYFFREVIQICIQTWNNLLWLELPWAASCWLDQVGVDDSKADRQEIPDLQNWNHFRSIFKLLWPDTVAIDRLLLKSVPGYKNLKEIGP